MTLLTYTLLTDPGPLEASKAGRPRSTGTVYLMVTNTGRDKAYWSKNRVEAPVGDGAEHLTPDITEIKATGEYHDQKPGGADAEGPAPGHDRVRVFRGHRPVGTQDRVRSRRLPGAEAGGRPVAAAAGLAVLRVEEAASRTQNAKPGSSVAVVPLVKTAPKQASAPCNFRADKALVDDGDTIVLRWDGPTDWAYTINLPDGTPASVTTPGEWRPGPGTGPKRDSTYTLIATDPATARQLVLTTAVQLRSPTFENGIHVPRVLGTANTGSLTFTSDGAVVGNPGGQGVVYADRIAARRVNAERVQGRRSGDGWISFPESGIQVSHGSYDTTPRIGAVYAESGIYQRQFAPGEENRWITLSDGGEISLEQRRKDGTTSYASLRVSRIESSSAQW